MPEIHIVNVNPGDCTIIKHISGRVTVMDICGGNKPTTATKSIGLASIFLEDRKPQGNFGMCNRTTNPIDYMQEIEVNEVFRFILSHPDMDHMDGIERLHNQIGIRNFWDTGFRRTESKPTFSTGFSRYRKEDWDFYEKAIEEKIPEITVVKKLAGDRFELANRKDNAGGGDGLYILAPNKDLLYDPDECDDINESSYVIQYSSMAGNIILPGDAHDSSWDFVMKEAAHLEGDCSFLLAPHHGRDSGRSFDFLDFLRPKLTVLGCAPSEHLSYDAWTTRGLDFITSNQAGNIVLSIQNGYYDVYIQNREYAVACGCDIGITNTQGYYFWKRVTN